MATSPSNSPNLLPIAENEISLKNNGPCRNFLQKQITSIINSNNSPLNEVDKGKEPFNRLINEAINLLEEEKPGGDQQDDYPTENTSSCDLKELNKSQEAEQQRITELLIDNMDGVRRLIDEYEKMILDFDSDDCLSNYEDED